MAQGRVKWFNSAKGFGFIVRQDGAEVFVHYTSIVHSGSSGAPVFKTLNEGQQVEFDLYDGPKGPQAMNVKLGEF